MRRRTRRQGLVLWPAAALAAVLASAASAAPPALRTTLKSGVLVARAPADSTLYPERNSGEALWRARFDLKATAGRGAEIEVAYEQRLRLTSEGAGLAAGVGILPRAADAPYRIRQLDWAIAESPTYSWRHEIDRALATARPGGFELTLGRQAVGWGRGVLFGAVDLFSPFTPLEADREWRRGIDAVRAAARLGGRFSAEGVAALADSLDGSAFVARARGYAGDVDAEIVGGRRARDWMAGLASSAAVGQAEVHGELAYFRTPEPLPEGGRDVWKGVAGGSYRVPWGNGLPVFVEYHYSGFGLRRAGDALAALADPSFQERFLRGDTQILGRHAVAVMASYEFSLELSAGVTLLVSPSDGSGLVSPDATYTLGDSVTLRALAYLPFGAKPRGGELESFYGGSPLSGYLQVTLYR